VKAAEFDLSGGRSPQLKEVRKAQSDRAFAFYQRLLQENRSDPAGSLQTGLICVAMLDAYCYRGEGAKGLDAYRQGVAVLRQLAAEFPTEKRYQQELNRIHLILPTYIGAYVGTFLIRELQNGRDEQAINLCRQAVTMSEAVIVEQPNEPNS